MTGFSLHSCMGMVVRGLESTLLLAQSFACYYTLLPLGMLQIETLLGFVFKASKNRSHFSIPVRVVSSVCPTISNYMAQKLRSIAKVESGSFPSWCLNLKRTRLPVFPRPQCLATQKNLLFQSVLPLSSEGMMTYLLKMNVRNLKELSPDHLKEGTSGSECKMVGFQHREVSVKKA